MSLKSGNEWMGELQGALIPVATYMALHRYGAVPDVDGRVSDALAALVEGSHRFEPQAGKDGLGYYLQYILSYVAGSLRNGAQNAKSEAASEACFTDLEADALGIERVYAVQAGGPDEEPDETLFAVRGGKVLSKMELVEAIAGDDTRRAVAAGVLGVQSDDPTLRVVLLRALDELEGQLNQDPRWTREVPEAEPVVTHDLEAVTILRNGVQAETLSAAEMREAVEAASAKAAVWCEEEVEDDERFESWPSWIAADQTRSYRSPYADDTAWPRSITRQVWADVVGAWAEVGEAGDVLDALTGGETEIPETARRAVEAMEVLAELLADETDGSAGTVARALANRLVRMGLRVEAEGGQLPAEAMAEAIGWALGVDLSAEEEVPMPTADGLRAAIEQWVSRANAARGVWKSQAAAVEALVLHNASPQEARQAARAAFAAGRA